jgi:hypothetical protein
MAEFGRIRSQSTPAIYSHSPSGPFIQRAPIYNSPLSQLAPTQQAPQRVVLPVVGSTPISNADFNLIMHHKFGVQNIRTGTLQEQETSLTRHNLPPATIPNWQSWNPGGSSMIYNYIIEAFEQFGQSLGATPIVSTITFYKMNYDRDANGVVISQPTVGASFGLTDLNIFEALTTLNSPLPYTRSITGTYKNSPVVGSVTTGSTPGAPMPVPSRSESVIRMITHELGHGAQSAAMNLPNPVQAPDPQMLNDYELAVGWTGSPMKLFDIGVPAVANALSTGTTPPSQYEITPSHWNDPRWIEQPVSHYSVDGGPGEDFAEAIMVYVNDPALLQSRSPARYNFIKNRSGVWLFNMRLYKKHPSAPGDYPQRVLPGGSEYA